MSATDLDDFTEEFLARAKILKVNDGKVEASERSVDVTEEKSQEESDVPF